MAVAAAAAAVVVVAATVVMWSQRLCMLIRLRPLAPCCSRWAAHCFPGCHEGVDSDLVAATATALREMIRWLCDHQGFTPYEALVVCSAAADFKIAEGKTLRVSSAISALCCLSLWTHS